MNWLLAYFLLVLGFGLGYITAGSIRRMNEDAVERAKRAGERLVKALQLVEGRYEIMIYRVEGGVADLHPQTGDHK